MLLKTVLDTDCRSAAAVDQMLPEYRLHRMTYWVQTVVFFTARKGRMDI